jgi:enamine deaminase RidA (YjgF/YER057c/UK114 family)
LTGAHAPRLPLASVSKARPDGPHPGGFAFDGLYGSRQALLNGPDDQRRGTTMSAEARLKQLGIVLPEVPAPVANYLPYRIAGNLLFLAGQGPRGADGKMLTGKVGAEISVEEGYQRARIIGLQLLSATRKALGSLDRVDTIVKMLCMVNAVPEFKDHPKVANGMSDLFVEVFGENGKHARSAVGMGSLPNQISVEVEGIFSIKP